MDDFKVYLLNKVRQLESERDNLRTELKVTKQALESLKGERDDLRKAANELRRWATCEHLHHDKVDQHEADEPCKVLARIDKALKESTHD